MVVRLLPPVVCCAMASAMTACSMGAGVADGLTELLVADGTKGGVLLFAEMGAACGCSAVTCPSTEAFAVALSRRASSLAVGSGGGPSDVVDDAGAAS